MKLKRKPKPAIAGAKYETFDSAPDTGLYRGAHVRAYTSKLRKTVTGPSGEVLYFVCPTIKGNKVWRAFVAWRPEGEEHYDQFVDASLLHLESTPPPEPRGQFGAELKHDEPEPLQSNAWSNPEDAPEGAVEHKFDSSYGPCDCGGDLKFDPDVVGDTCGGLTLIGWDMCVKCGKGYLSTKGVVHEGKWKLAGGGRSVETGVGRIRVDGAKDPLTLMARIAKLPELELEVAQLRKQLENSTRSPHGRRVDVFQPSPEAAASPWKECQLVVNGIELKDGDRILLINQPAAVGNGVRVIRLEKP